MKIKVTFIMDKSFNVHVFSGNVQRIKWIRQGSEVIVGGFASIVWFRYYSAPWFRLLHHMGETKWQHLKNGMPIVEDTFDFGEMDEKKLTGK